LTRIVTVLLEQAKMEDDVFLDLPQIDTLLLEINKTKDT